MRGIHHTLLWRRHAVKWLIPGGTIKRIDGGMDAALGLHPELYLELRRRQFGPRYNVLKHARHHRRSPPVLATAVAVHLVRMGMMGMMGMMTGIGDRRGR